MSEIVENKPPIVPLTLWPGAPPVYVPREDTDDAAALLRGERALLPEVGEPDVRRILDLCPRAGEFAIYARVRWPVAWCDLVAGDDEEEVLCRLNAAPGARVFRDVPSGRYDLVRLDDASLVDFITDSTHIVFLDGAVVSAIDGFVLAASGMRSKGHGFQYWVRSRFA